MGTFSEVPSLVDRGSYGTFLDLHDIFVLDNCSSCLQIPCVISLRLAEATTNYGLRMCRERKLEIPVAL